MRVFSICSLGINNNRKLSFMFLRACLLLFLFLSLCTSSIYAEEKRGGIALAFDDGYPSWINTIVPELAKVGGAATVFVNNQRIHNGHLSFEELRMLQNKYGWEIGTHTYHHFNAVEYVRRNSLDKWVKEELETSLSELHSHGLKIHSIAFPFNTSNTELGAAVLNYLESFRQLSAYPISKSKNINGSYNATPFDISRYIPLEQVFSWVDFAQQQDLIVFLYGHEVLKDEEFIEGTVDSVSESKLFSKDVIKPTVNSDLCLVPDKRRRIYRTPIRIEHIHGKTITIFHDNLSGITTPGATFIIGPCYGIPLSYFQKVVEYAAKKVPLYTVHDALKKISVTVSK